MEAISNAFHALDAVFFRGIREGLCVRLSVGRGVCAGSSDGVESCRISIVDNGIGMTRGDLINNLSSLARFEDADVVDALEEAHEKAAAGSGGGGGGGEEEGEEDADFLRMGFWSAFLVAGRVLVQTKHDDDVHYLWELGSDDAHFVIRKGELAMSRSSEMLPELEGAPLGERGTAVHLLLKPSVVAGDGLMDEARLRAMAGGWGNAGMAVSSNYPLYFFSDTEGADAPLEDGAGKTGDGAGEGGGEGGGEVGGAGEGEGEGGADEQEDWDALLDSPEARVAQQGRGDGAAEAPPSWGGEHGTPSSMLERAKYIPLRLSYEDRKVLRLAESALGVSGYTDTIDSPALAVPNKAAKRLQTQLQSICALLSGLVVACDYENGSVLLDDRNFAQYVE